MYKHILVADVDQLAMSSKAMQDNGIEWKNEMMRQIKSANEQLLIDVERQTIDMGARMQSSVEHQLNDITLK